MTIEVKIFSAGRISESFMGADIMKKSFIEIQGYILCKILWGGIWLLGKKMNNEGAGGNK